MELTQKDARLLGKLTTRDEAGTHFTQLYPDEFLDRMEKAGYIEIIKPVHDCGIAYGQDEWGVRVTEAGIEAGEAMEWGETETLYKVEAIKINGGQYIPGTEVIAYTGNSDVEARKMFDLIAEDENTTVVGSTYVAGEDRWEIIWEK